MTGENDPREISEENEFDDLEESSYILEDWDEIDGVVSEIKEDVGKQLREAAGLDADEETLDADPFGEAGLDEDAGDDVGGEVADAIDEALALVDDPPASAEPAPAAAAWPADDGDEDDSDLDAWLASAEDPSSAGAQPPAAPTPEAAATAQPSAPASAAADSDDDLGLFDASELPGAPEDFLFEPGPTIDTGRATARRFDEDGGTAWGGAAQDSGDIGLPGGDAPAFAPPPAGDAAPGAAGEGQSFDSLETFEAFDPGDSLDDVTSFDIEEEPAFAAPPTPSFAGSAPADNVHSVSLDDEAEDWGDEESVAEDQGDWAEGDDDWRDDNEEYTSDSDPIYGEEGDEDYDGEEVAGEFDGDDYADDFEDFDDYAEPEIGAQERLDFGERERSRAPLWAAAAAAVLLLGGAGGYWAWQQRRGTAEDGGQVTLRRAEIARPDTRLAVAAPPDALPDAVATLTPPAIDVPVPEQGDPTEVDPIEIDPLVAIPQGDPETDPQTDPETDPQGDPGAVAQADPPPGGQTDPGGEALPQGGDPSVTIADPTLPPVSPPSQAARPTEEAPLAIGDELEIGGESAFAGIVDAQPPALEVDLVAGDHAFAELKNGNYFIGNVKALDANDITLRLEAGEVTLPFTVLRQVGSVDSEEFTQLRQQRTGFIRLNNQNRIRGGISARGDGRDVAIGQHARVVIPDTEIMEITDEDPAGVRLGEESDDEWVRSLVRERLRKQAAPRAAEPPQPPQPQPQPPAGGK